MIVSQVFTEDNRPDYLKASRKHLENARRNVAGLGSCCGFSGIAAGLDRLWMNQLVYESQLVKKSSGNMGLLLPLVIVAGASVLGISAKAIYDHYTSSKQYDQYTACLNKLMDQGYDAEKAREICTMQRNDIAGVLQKMGQVARVAFIGAAVLFGVYIFFKLRK